MKIQTYEEQQELFTRARKHNIGLIFPFLESKGVTSVTIFFSGSCDSGGIDDTMFFDNDNQRVLIEPEKEKFKGLAAQARRDENSPDYYYVIEEFALTLDDLLYALMGQEDSIGFNNEGSEGQIDIVVATREVTFEVTTPVPYTETTTRNF